MYTENGKPIANPYTHKSNGVSRQEFEYLKMDVIALQKEIELLKGSAPKQDDKKEPVKQTDDINALKTEAAELGIEVKGNWGAKRIKQAIEDAKAEQ